MRTATDIQDHHNIRNLRDLRVMSRLHRSGKPTLPTTAMINLSMASHERRRLQLERLQLQRREVQIARRLEEVEREMDALLAAAVESARAVRGSAAGGTEPRTRVAASRSRPRGRRGARAVIEY